MTELEFLDVQGIVFWGYGDKPDAAYLLLEIVDASAAKSWLARGDFTHAGEEENPEVRINIAFTYSGLKALGVPGPTLSGFSPEFQDGMVSPERSRMLGDVDDVAPATWSWGAAMDNRVAKADPSATRSTLDVDLLVNQADLDAVTAAFNGLGFERHDLRR